MRTWAGAAMAAVAATLLSAGGPVAAAPAKAPSAVQTLLDREMIRELMARYQWALDTGDAEAYAALFADDAVLISGPTQTKGKPAIVQEIRDLAKRFNAAGQAPAAPGAPPRPPLKVQHVFTNVVIDLQGDHATAKSYWTEVWNLRAGVPEVGAAGHYNDVLVKQNGAWMFSRREIVGDMSQPRTAPAPAVKPAGS